MALSVSFDSDGLFSGISAAGGGAVDNQFDGLIIGVTLDAGASSQTAVLADLSQIALEVRAADPDPRSDCCCEQRVYAEVERCR